MRLILFVITVALIYSCSSPDQYKEPSEKDIERMNEKLYPYEDFFLEKTYGGEFSYERYLQSIDYIARERTYQRSDGEWLTEGPGNLGARINTIAVNPTDDQNILLGYAESGVYRTRDGGQSWEPIFDDQARLGIGDIVFDPNDSNTIYVGTGDPNISGFPVIGDGLWKSTDGGDTWTYVGLEEARIISKIDISPTNSDLIYASAMGLPFLETPDRGLYKTTDGGASWEKILYINESAGVIDFLMDPNDNDVLYAASWNRIRNNKVSIVSGPDAHIFKSTDGGVSWDTLKVGLPEGPQSRIALAMSGNNSNKLYACYVGTDLDFAGLFTSDDAGQSWTEINSTEESGFDRSVFRGFGWYFGKLVVNPNDDDNIFVLGVDMYATYDGGESWDLAAPPWYTYDVHADKHDLVFSGETAYLATDGGAYSATATEMIWEDIENIPATQFYRVANDPHNSNRYLGGAQDNGTSGGNNAMINSWPRIFGGDGFQPAFDPFNPNVLWVETQRGGLNVSLDGGNYFDSAMNGVGSESRNWDMPYVISAVEDRAYLGTTRVYRNETGPEEPFWIPISPVLIDTVELGRNENITTLSESPVNPDILFAGTGDGEVWRSTDGGDNWDNVGDEIPINYISDVIGSRDNESVVFASVSGYRDNDFSAYLYRSDNYGDNWVSIQGDHPMVSINELYAMEGYESNVLFTATDGGVYYTINGGVNWDRLGNNMPTVPVYDLDYDPELNKLIAGTFSKSIMSFDLEQVALQPTNTNVVLSDHITISTLNQHELSVFSKTQLLADYEIFDANGRRLDVGTLQGNRIRLDGLPTGMYFLNLKLDGDLVSKQFFIANN